MHQGMSEWEIISEMRDGIMDGWMMESDKVKGSGMDKGMDVFTCFADMNLSWEPRLNCFLAYKTN